MSRRAIGETKTNAMIKKLLPMTLTYEQLEISEVKWSHHFLYYFYIFILTFSPLCFWCSDRWIKAFMNGHKMTIYASRLNEMIITKRILQLFILPRMNLNWLRIQDNGEKNFNYWTMRLRKERERERERAKKITERIERHKCHFQSIFKMQNVQQTISFICMSMTFQFKEFEFIKNAR